MCAWMWWNLFGLVITCVSTWAISRFTEPPEAEVLEKYTLDLGDLKEREPPWIKVYIGLGFYFIFILGIGYAFNFIVPAGATP